MSGLCSEDFMKLTIQDVADLLVDRFDETDREYSCAKLLGCNGGRMFELEIILRCKK